jgi:hypothetical protein
MMGIPYLAARFEFVMGTPANWAEVRARLRWLGALVGGETALTMFVPSTAFVPIAAWAAVAQRAKAATHTNLSRKIRTGFFVDTALLPLPQDSKHQSSAPKLGRWIPMNFICATNIPVRWGYSQTSFYFTVISVRNVSPYCYVRARTRLCARRGSSQRKGFRPAGSGAGLWKQSAPRLCDCPLGSPR